MTEFRESSSKRLIEPNESEDMSTTRRREAEQERVIKIAMKKNNFRNKLGDHDLGGVEDSCKSIQADLEKYVHRMFKPPVPLHAATAALDRDIKNYGQMLKQTSITKFLLRNNLRK